MEKITKSDLVIYALLTSAGGGALSTVAYLALQSAIAGAVVSGITLVALVVIVVKYFTQPVKS